MAALRSNRRHLLPAAQRLPLIPLLFRRKNSGRPAFAAETPALSQQTGSNNSEETAK
jgi:hypothetical protein